MASSHDPRIREVFARLHEQTDRDFSRGNVLAVRSAFEDAKTRHACLRDVSFLHFVEYSEDIVDDENDRAVQESHKSTVSELWITLLTRPDNNDSSVDKLVRFLVDSEFPSKEIPLGRLWGQYRLGLVPDAAMLYEGALQPVHFDRDSGLDLAEHGGLCVKYGEAHPSEGATRLISPGRPILRRFWGVGWIVIDRGGGWWQKTGHVLVIDLDTPDREPWIILASSWETDEDEPLNRIPPEYVTEHDPYGFGVLPGDTKRTTVGKLKLEDQSPQDQSSQHRSPQDPSPQVPSSQPPTPLLTHFNPKCNLTLATHPGTETLRTDSGPVLGEVMFWLKRHDGTEVCFDKNRKEYLLRDPKTGEYAWPAG